MLLMKNIILGNMVNRKLSLFEFFCYNKRGDSMKNIFIGGVAKSGKSRLSEYLCKKYGMNHIPVDYFASSFKHNFNEIGITSNVVIDKKSSELLAKFLSRFIEIVESKDDELFVIDSAHIYPVDIIKYLNPSKWDIYYLGYPNITSIEKIEEIKKYSKGGWTSKKNDEELIKTFDELIKISKDIENECKSNNITFIDTSNEDIIKLFIK